MQTWRNRTKPVVGKYNARTGKKNTGIELKEKLMTDNDKHLKRDNGDQVREGGTGA